MVFVNVDGVAYNTNSIRRIVKPTTRNGKFVFVYAGHDKPELTRAQFERFATGLRGKKLITPEDMTALMAVPSETDTELADEDTPSEDDGYY